MRESTSDLVRKLVAVGVFLGTVSVSDTGSSTFAFASATRDQWAVSDASTYRLPQKSSTADIELAIAEVRSARGILATRELRGEAAFEEYLGAIDTALKVYDQAGVAGPGREMRLATALAVARTALLDGVTRLASWTAVVRSAGFAERFATAPSRFLSPPAPLAHSEGAHNEAAMQTWLDLDTLEV
ncbi:MAG: hypothetical protein U0169_11060 [Polyangiaceae bacterium]